MPLPVRSSKAAVLVAVATSLLLLLAPAASAATDPPLRAGQRLVDAAGALGPAEAADVRSRLGSLAAAGTDPVVVVREREATADQALEQVEDLQQSWVAATGADQDVAVAVLVDLAPADGTPRVGIYVGRDLREGALPEDVLADVVADARGPVRDGDVHRGLVLALDRLGTAVRAGPPEPSRADRFAQRAATTWLPWTLLALAAAGLVGALPTFAGRPSVERTWPPPTRQRPDALPAAVGAALALGGPAPSAVPAVVVDLAARGALTIEREGPPPQRGGGTVAVRLGERPRRPDAVEAAVWDALAGQAQDGVVGSSALARLARSASGVHDAVVDELASRGWWEQGAGRARTLLGVVAAATAVLGVVGLLLGAVAGSGTSVGAALALAAVAVAAAVMASRYPRLSRSGLEAARGWRAYRDGLRLAADMGSVPLDLDAVLPDALAMNLGLAMRPRLEEAEGADAPPRALAAASTSVVGVSWVAFSGTFFAGPGGGGYGGGMSGGIVTGGGSGGGGGAAG